MNNIIRERGKRNTVARVESFKLRKNKTGIPEPRGTLGQNDLSKIPGWKSNLPVYHNIILISGLAMLNTAPIWQLQLRPNKYDKSRPTVVISSASMRATDNRINNIKAR